MINFIFRGLVTLIHYLDTTAIKLCRPFSDMSKEREEGFVLEPFTIIIRSLKKKSNKV